MEGIYDLFCFSINEHDGKLYHLVQIGPRVLFAGALEVEHTNYLRGGALLWWCWGWGSRSLALLAALASPTFDAGEARAFGGECYCRRGEEGEAHGVLQQSQYAEFFCSALGLA